MIQKMKKMQKKDNKGFTLVELIVVLVILAILAAILVPALLGYIDRAKQQQIVLNAKSCYTAAQAELSSMYGQGVKPNDTTLSSTSDYGKRIIATADVSTVCEQLKIGTNGKEDGTDHVDYTVTYVEYKEGGKSIFFDGKSWVESTSTASPSAIYTIKSGS